MKSYGLEEQSRLILIAEDSPTQAQELTYFLERHGYQCQLARNGREALSLLQSLRPVLIISDVMMPEMDGFEFCRQVKEGARYDQIPVILLTSLSDTADIIRGLECGADSFVTKPYEKDYLLSQIDSILVNRRLRSQDSQSSGVEVEFAGKHHLITSEPRQILDLLLSTYDQAVGINQKLKLRERELEASNARLSALHAIGSAVSQSLNLSRILNDALDKLIEVVGVDIAAVLLFESGQLVLKAYRNVPEEMVEQVSQPRDGPSWVDPLGQISEMIVVPSGLTSAGTALPADICADVGQKLNCASIMCLPLRSKGVIQALLLSGTSYHHELTQADIELMQGVSNQLAVALENVRLFEAERESRKEAEAANRAKDEFLAMVSHELRTPLSAMLGWTRLLRGGKLEQAETGKAIEAIERSAQAQVQLVNDLLDVSRMVAGKLILNLEEIDLASVIISAVEDLKAPAATKGISLDVSIDDDLSRMTGDAVRLRQVITNMVSNAIKFTPKDGAIEIDVESARDFPGEYVRLRVKDNGVGISQEFLPHIFERFRQADTSNARQHGGLGLGLTIVRHIVELHGGSISAESEGKGRGATFTVILPSRSVIRQTGNLIAPLNLVGSEDSSVLPMGLQGVKILVVEDQDDARAMFAIVLNQYGAEVTAVASAAEAIEALHWLKPDVLVSDIAMPGEDGFELIKRVRSLSVEDGGQVPAVAITAITAENDQSILAAGFQKHLLKPVEPGELAAAVASLIEADNLKARV